MNQYIGRLLDNRYEILEVIGNGGMAVVYKALCHRLNRLVAVKILKDEFSGDEEFRRRFRAEGEAVAMLSHPNIVQVYDVSSADNANFIVMELIDGISLHQYIHSKGILNWKETLHFSMQIAQGLEHAHSRGIVHRDIKPHNVMVLKNGSVKVMDFGIARVMTKSNTLTKEALGSVHYISPEQAKGGYTDNRSDIYSLSVVMYEMMAGRPPFDGDSPVSVAIQHINGGAPRPSTYNPNIPLGLEQIIMKGMALNVNDRYASATEMLKDMEEFRKNPGIVFDYTPANGTVDRLKKFPTPVKPKNTAERVAKSKGGTVTPPRDTGRMVSTDSMRVSAGTGRIGTGSRPQESDAIRRAQQRRQQEQLHRKQERSGMAIAAVVTCSAVAVIAIIVFLVAIFNGALLNRERDLVDVPQLVGEYFTEELENRYSNLSIRQRPAEYSTTFAKGMIMKQDPSGGSQVMKGSEIFITVSLGEEPAAPEMENLTGISGAQAKEFLEKQGYRVLSYEEETSLFEPEKVIRTDPTSGVPLTDGQTIKIWVSTTPKAVMPNVVGLNRKEAEKSLESLGFTDVTVNEVSSEKPEGQIISQSVKDKQKINVDTPILLEVSSAIIVETTEEVTAATEEPVYVTKVVNFTLPHRDVAYQLSIRKGDEEILPSMEIQPGSYGVNLELTDSGEQEYELYINGEFYEKQKVNFADNG